MKCETGRDFLWDTDQEAMLTKLSIFNGISILGCLYRNFRSSVSEHFKVDTVMVPLPGASQ